MTCMSTVLISELYNNVFLPTPNSGGSQGDREFAHYIWLYGYSVV